MNESFDVVIIGAGQAGIPLARELAKAGKRVALAERKHLGGSCINFGCTPTKAAIASARVAHLARRGADFGLRIPTVEVDFAAVIDRARAIVDEYRRGLERNFGENPKLIRGHARIDGREGGRFRVVVGARTSGPQSGDLWSPDRSTDQRSADYGLEVRAPHVVLDTGTRSNLPPIDGLAGLDILHAGNWLERRTLPAKLTVIGGGVIAVEMAQFYRRMGSAVTIRESRPRLVSTEDPEVSETLQTIFEREGIELRLGAKADRADGDVFVATGRTPNTADLGLETVGVDVNKGIVRVDQRLSTNVPGIWAAGDIRGGPMFTHTAWDDYRILFSQLAGDGSRTTDRVVPYAIFTDPEIGRVGMNEAEARASGKEIKVSRFDVRKNSKAVEIGETDGFIKVITDAKSDEILGATVFCHEGGEIVHLFVDLMNARRPAAVIREAVHIHPTLAEAIQSAL